MQNKPLVTIVCLCYNHAAFVTKALDSVVSQTYPNIELLIADDCSTDNSVEIIEDWLEKHPTLSFTVNPVNKGNTKTFNSLLHKASGKYIIDLAADDVLMPKAVDILVNSFEHSNFENVAIVYGNLEIIDENDAHLEYYYPVDEKLKALRTPPSGDIYCSILASKEKINSVASMIKTDVLKSLGGYDETLTYEDLDIWMKVAKQYHFVYIDEILVQKRELSTSLYQQFFKKNNAFTYKMNASTYKILSKAFKQNTHFREDKAMLKRVHYEMVLNYNNRNFGLLYKYVLLKLKIHLGLRI